MKRFYVKTDNDLECYRLMEREGIVNEGKKEDAVVADFYQPEPIIAELLMDILNKDLLK